MFQSFLTALHVKEMKANYCNVNTLPMEFLTVLKAKKLEYNALVYSHLYCMFVLLFK